jgi:putative oxidoreductase
MEAKYYILELMVRIMLSFLFIFQGYDKIFKVGANAIHEYFSDNFERMNLNPFLGRVLINGSSWVELIGGILLLFGILRIYVLFVLLAEMVLISIFFSWMKPMWDTRHVWPRLVLLVFLIIIPGSWARITLDYLILNK